jgi:glycosyltransferase involved in cell wall biosynthesis
VENGRIAGSSADEVNRRIFSGKLHSATRRYGATLLSKLDAEGIRVDLSTVDIDRPEYLKRLADAHLAWSPEGLGWQTFRVFEAAAAGSVPIVNRGQIEMPDPLRNGEHCFYYDPQDNEQDNDLIRVIKQALSDKERLNRMGEAARAHVLRHHTHKTVVNQIMTAVCDRHPSLRSARYP